MASELLIVLGVLCQDGETTCTWVETKKSEALLENVAAKYYVGRAERVRLHSFPMPWSSTYSFVSLF